MRCDKGGREEKKKNMKEEGMKRKRELKEGKDGGNRV